MKKNIFNKLLILSIIIGFISCNPGKYPGFKKTNTGMYYKFYHINKDSLKPVIGDILTVEMIYRTNDSLLFDGTNMPFHLRLEKPSFKGDFTEGLAMMHVGDSATFIVNADSTFLRTFRLKTLPEYIDSASVMYFDIKLSKIQSAEQLQAQLKKQLSQMKLNEKEDLKEYIEKNDIKVKPTESGLYYIELKKGSGPKAKEGKTVKIHYTAAFLNGKKFDSSYDHPDTKPLEFHLTKHAVIKGLDEGIEKMRVGGKARLIIPSNIAYGDKGRGNIPPYSTLVFDVELIDMK